MKRLALLAFAIAVIGVTGAWVSGPNKHIGRGDLSYPPFYSLNDDDPVVVGGITGELLQSYLNAGWTQGTTSQSKADAVVQFRNPTTHELEWRIGTLPANTQYIYKDGAYVFVTCGNPGEGSVY